MFERTLAVDGLTERVHDAAEQGVADVHRQNATRRAHDLLFFDVVDRAEDDAANGLLVEVHSETHGAVFELEQFVHLRLGQTRHARDPVTDLHDTPDLLGRDGGVEVGHVLTQCLSDLAGANGELRHHVFLFLIVSLESGFEVSTGRDRVVQRAQSTFGGGVESKVADLDEDAPEKRGIVSDLEFDVFAGDGVQRVNQIVLDVGVEFSRGMHASDPPVARLGDVVHEVVEGSHDVARSSPDDGELCQGQGDGIYLALEQLIGEPETRLQGRVAIEQQLTEALVSLNRAGPAKEVIFNGGEVLGIDLFEQGVGETGDAPARVQQTEAGVGKLAHVTKSTGS